MSLYLNIRQKGVILTSVPLLFLAAFITLVIQVQHGNKQAEVLSLRSKELVLQSQTLSRKLNDAETSVLGYLLTSDADLLAPYNRSSREIGLTLARLRALEPEPNLQQALAAHLADDSTCRMGVLGRALTLARSGDRAGAIAIIKSQANWQARAEFHQDLELFRQDVDQQDGARDVMLARSWEHLYSMLVGGAAIGVLLNLLLSLLFSTGISTRVMRLTIDAQRLADGEAPGSPVGGADEISRLDQVFRGMAAALASAARRERAIIENALDVICSVDADGFFVKVSPASVKLWGYAPEELVGCRFTEVISPDDVASASRMFREAMAGNCSQDFEAHCRHKNGALLTMTWSAFWSPAEKLVFCVAHDITERKKMEEQIWHRAYHDSLTNLPNRVLFNDRLTLALAQAKRNHQVLAVMFMDLDRFKVINDTLGHSIGDELLKEVARRVKGCIRASDTVARIGGDEFTVLLPQITHAEDAGKVAAKIREIVAQPWMFAGHQVNITASIGIALYPDDGEDAETLLGKADTAQYRIKSRQRDSFQFYASSMTECSVQRLEIESELRKALDQRELVLYYQPLVNLHSGAIVGVEALVRWNHQQLGMLPPSHFLPIAEESGLIIPLGESVLRSACAQGMIWQNAGFPSMRLSVNIAARQLRCSNLVVMVRHALEDTGLNPCWLELEISESSLMGDVDSSLRILNELRELGVRISLDNFGSGYSSIACLRRLPLDTVKIDQSLVRDVTTDPDCDALVSTIITLARGLNRKVVAEGVETQEQLKFLREAGCDERQGYLFSRPLPAEEVALLLKHAHNGEQVLL